MSKSLCMSKEKDKFSLCWDSYNNVKIQRKKRYHYEVKNLKKILINKMNNQIEELIKGKNKLYLNNNKNLFFLGFCDLLFEMGFCI